MLPLFLVPTFAHAQEFDAELSGHLKSFLVLTFPYDELADIDFAVNQSAAADGRLNLRLSYKKLSFEAHHAVTPTLNTAVNLGAGTSTGVGVVAPEAIDLTWNTEEPGGLAIQGRTDRLFVRGAIEPVDITVGRQPISFGTGLFFTPMDLVNPFFPTVIDQEYKPGVDAVRVDTFLGLSRITVVGAYTDPSGLNLFGREGEDEALALEDFSMAVYGQTTIGVTDLSMFLGEIHADEVLGVSVASSIGPVGVHGDATVTLPAEDAAEEEPFVRAVIGADGRPTEDLSISGEIYLQTLGTTDSEEYVSQLLGERYARGELWLVGVAYGGLAVGYQLTPLVTLNLAGFINLTDGSVLLAPTLGWSVSGNAELALGVFAGVGERPSFSLPNLSYNTEFGAAPVTGFFQVRTYF